MSWIEQLIQTYDNCSEHIGQSDGATPLLPICHSTQNAHIEVIIDGNGAFKRAHVISKDESETIIPCTEESGGRTGSKPINHPLCDKLQYLGGDFLKFGGVVTSGYLKNPEKPHIKYLEELHQWCVSEHRHPKVEAIYAYLSKGSLISDLCSAGILPYDMSTGKLTKIWEGPLKEGPEIFRVMPKGKAPEEAFVRWVVEIPNDPSSKLWKDESVWKSWALYYAASQAEIKDICYVTGQVTQLAKQHPAKLRHAADKAKLISSNDTGGFTYRGRFNDCKGRQACGIGYEVTQKAHNALRWLLARQGYNDGNLAVVAWAVSGQKIPDPLGDSSLLSDEELPTSNKSYIAQDFALRLNKKIRGYRSELGDSTDIIVLAIDSATNGRMSLLYHRMLSSSEFLTKLEAWHQQCCWLQLYDSKMQFIGAPAPKDIAETAYGIHLNPKLKSAIVRQLLSCIIGEMQVPDNLLQSCFKRVCNRESFKSKGPVNWNWEKALGITCALYHKHFYNKRNYQMSLEKELASRDYLYGRLLALAEYLEEVALRIGNEKRPTNVARLMQHFADKPYSTWRTLELQLQPYKNRLKTSRGGFLYNIETELDAVMALFKPEEFTSAAKLSGEFLLGYHCQRAALKQKSSSLADSQESTEETHSQDNF